ncbi:uncharacterized protein LOC135489531 [Lineus longissimus]|uniref:uncharacterized protein LOC135489531 n=1 Tax=Lineus longissimus TaxID=88925 RepID=UPI00315C7FF3
MKRKPHRSIRVQARPTTFTQGTQTDMLPTCVCQAEGGRSSEVEQLPSESGRAVTDVTLTDEESLMDTDDESTYPEKDDDPDYVPDSDESEEEQDFLDDPVEKEQDPVSEKKYLVFHSSLMSLFATCPVCCSVSSRQIKQIGTFISVHQQCTNQGCGFSRSWNSQSMYGNLPAGNVLQSSAILFSGAIPSQVLQVFNILGCQTICRNTLFNHQRQYLCPAVEAVWTAEQGEVLNAVKGQDTPLVVGGDGRSDTPGHSAKYGSYSLMNLDSKKIVSMELVQSTEVKSSVHMKKEGLKD